MTQQAKAGDVGSVPASERSLRGGNGKPLLSQVFLLGKSYGQRSLAGYSPQSHKESDRT